MKQFIRDCKEELKRVPLGAEERELLFTVMALTAAAFTAIVCVQVLAGIGE